MEKLAASSQRFSRLQVCRYAQQIASGLAFLHRQSVLHRDLKVRFHHRLLRNSPVTHCPGITDRQHPRVGDPRQRDQRSPDRRL